MCYIKFIWLFTFIFFSNSLFLCAQSISFNPVVTSYTALDYNAGVQNWSIAQDKNGLMYFGNNMGLLVFDGNNWKLYSLPNNGTVRSLLIDDERIYVGSFEEFGYFERDDTNNLIYYSLKSLVKNYKFFNEEIWTILKYEDNIMFQSFGSVFLYNESKTSIKQIKARSLNLFEIGNVCYSQQIGGNLCKLNEGKFVDYIQREKFNNRSVVSGLPFENGTLFLTDKEGGFIWKNNKLERWHTECDDFFKNNTINHAILTKDSCYVIGTISNGIYALSKDGKKIWEENTLVNLKNNTVLGLFCDFDNNIWAVLDNGIVYIQNNSLISNYKPIQYNIGMVYDALIQSDTSYLASNQGLFMCKNNKLYQVDKISEQAWYVRKIGNQIFCGHNKGTSLVEGLTSQIISKQGGLCLENMNLLGQSYLIGGTYGSLEIYKKSDSGQYRFLYPLEGSSHLITEIEIDSRGDIWARHMKKGFYHLRINRDSRNLELLKKVHNLDNSNNGNYFICKIENEIVLSDGKLFYKYDSIHDDVISYREMNSQLVFMDEIHDVTHFYEYFYWFVGMRNIYKIYCKDDIFKIYDVIPYSKFDNQNVEERAKIVCDANERISYLCLNNQIVKISSDSSFLYRNSIMPKLFISEMMVYNEKNDSLVLLSPNICNNIEYDFNSLKFRLSYPSYADKTYKVRYQLKGLSEQWFEGERTLYKEFSRLSAGEYLFKAEIYDGENILASDQVSFFISPPWYFSKLFIFIYFIIGTLLIFASQYIVYSYTKNKKDKIIEKQRLMHQSEMQIKENKIIKLENEKLEADLRFKSKELSSVIMTNIAHQEFINHLKNEIIQLKETENDLPRCLEKLLLLIQNNITYNDDNWDKFLTNFDCIHEKFFRNLKDQYPDLTSNDLRFCALLRLNMPTKEIAQFLNMSVRGVETARYRLRKKLHITQDVNLTDFMIKIK